MTINLSQSRLLGCAACLALAALALGGCGSKDAASYVASAKTYMAKVDYNAAIIELKNALQKDPDNGEARILLASALLETGDVLGAEVQARKAIELHVPNDRTYPVLARSLASRGEYKKLVADVADRNISDKHARAEVGAALASAALAEGDLAKAKRLADAAYADDPANVRVLLTEAYVAAGQNDPKAAHGFVDAAMKVAPDDIAVILVKSSLAAAEGKLDDAHAVLTKAVASHPNSLPIRYALFELAGKRANVDEAKEQAASMKKIAPKDPRSNYADALVSFSANDNAHAKEAIQTTLARAPDYLPAVLLSGMIDARLGNFSSAEDALRKVVAKAPDQAAARRLLASMYLRAGRAPQALETIEPALRRNPDDPALLRLAGEAHLATGNTGAAAEAYERANTLDKGNVGSQVRLAQVRMAAGDTTEGMNALESIAATNKSEFQAELALYSEYMRKRQYDKALAQVDAIEAKRPSMPLISSLRGAAYLAKRDLKQARSNFEKALETPSTANQAAHSLAIIDLQEGKVQAARDRYERMLAKDPKNETLQLELAELLAVSGAPSADVKAAIDKAIVANPSSVRARLALVGFAQRQGDRNGAVAAAQAGLAALPDNPPLTEALGMAQLGAGQKDEAANTFRRLVQLQPQNPGPLLRLAEVQVAAKDYVGAIESERKALQVKPDDPRALSALTTTYVISGRIDAALAEAHRLQKDFPDKALGYALEGDLLLREKKWTEAAAAYKAATQRQPIPLLVAREYAALRAAGKQAEASTVVKNWMTSHPTDTFIPLALADENLKRKDSAAAQRGYEQVLAIDPNNFQALNNLATILAEKKDPKAIEYAERAHRLAPFNPAVLDTLGWTLTQNAEAKRGVELLRMATRLAPGQPEIRLHLAKALAAVGDKAGAREQIAELSKLDKSSPIRIEAEKLQASL